MNVIQHVMQLILIAIAQILGSMPAVPPAALPVEPAAAVAPAGPAAAPIESIEPPAPVPPASAVAPAAPSAPAVASLAPTPGDTPTSTSVAEAAAISGFGDLGEAVVNQAVAVIWCESRGDASAHRTTNNPDRLTGDIGLFQINHIHTGTLVAAGIISARSDLFDPAANAAAARHLYASGDWQPWQMSRHCWG